MVDILLATYNGAAYIEEQVRSLIAQTYTQWRLLVHDDGSTDQTLAILKSLAAEDERVLLIEDGIVGLGVERNFIHLLRHSTAPYCMFCDQDDVWLPQKIDRMLEVMQQHDQSKPQVLYSNAFLWSTERGIISDKNTLTYPTTLRKTLFLNTGIQGAAALMNSKMREIVAEPLTYYAMHDHVLLLAGLCFGEVHYLHESLMYYRQHDKNVTGNAPGSKLKKLLLMWENRHVRLVSRVHYEGLKAFYERWQTEMQADDKLVVEAFLAMPSKQSFSRVTDIIKYRFELFDSVWLLLIKYCMRRYI